MSGRTASEGAAFAEVAFIREHRADFGPYMRELRQRRGLSLRDASRQLGVAFSKLQKMECGGRFRIHSLRIIADIADLYCVSPDEVFHAAGIRPLTPDSIPDARDEVDKAFARLMLHPALRPTGVDVRWLDSFSSRQKRQLIELAQRVRAFCRSGGNLDEVLALDCSDSLDCLVVDPVRAGEQG